MGCQWGLEGTASESHASPSAADVINHQAGLADALPGFRKVSMIFSGAGQVPCNPGSGARPLFVDNVWIFRNVHCQPRVFQKGTRDARIVRRGRNVASEAVPLSVLLKSEKLDWNS